jgi:two-component system response regulator HydG
MRNGAYDFIQKPLDLEVIRTQVRRAAEKIFLTRKTHELSNALDQRFGIHGIIGQSAAMQRILQLIAQIAPTDINVLILGESGTGKELVARALHQNSRRRVNRFVALNCAGLNESTLEDELFGHVRGAFTDARGDREGRFEYAEGGTLFLDEIGDMPLTMQAKLLRVLQDREITRLGSNDPIKVDVRFLAATNKDLLHEVHNKTFREDLYFRIKGAVIQLPPLRERRDDIPLLINHVLSRSLEKLGKKVDGIDADAKNALVAYNWPGNVRELENTIENMIVLAQGPKLTLADVPSNITGNSPSTAIIHTPAGSAPSTAITLAGKNLADLEKQAIEETLTAVQGNREQAAKILGIGERTLYRKIKEYGLKE